MKNALVTLILAQAGLASGPAVGADGGPAQPSNGVLRDGNRGFRDAEHVLADLTDVGSTHSRYLEHAAEDARTLWEESRGATCHRSVPCSYIRYFDISVGGRTKVALLFLLRLSETGRTICGDRRPDKSCDISASVFVAGDEAFPNCVAAGPVRAAAIRHGWRLFPVRHPTYPSEKYRHEDDKDTYLFIRTMKDSRCFRSVYIARIHTAPVRPQ